MTPAAFPVFCSVLDGAALGAEVARRYRLGPPERCWLLVRNLTDTYEVRAGCARYALRVYHAGVRSLEDVSYEVDLLRHLEAGGVRVAAPIAQADGEAVWKVPAPEGERPAVLFRWVDGEERPRPHPSERYGRAVAELHAALAHFSSPHARFPIDADRLLARSMAALEPYLAELPADVGAFLRAAAAALRERIDAVAPGLEWGPIHGDLHGGNALFSDGGIAFIDFDDCGEGWRAFELAVFRWGCTLPGSTRDWDSFLRGYAAVRPVAPADLAAVPLFVAVRIVSWLGMMATHTPRWGGRLHLDAAFFARPLAALVDWFAAHADLLERPAPVWACERPDATAGA